MIYEIEIIDEEVKSTLPECVDIKMAEYLFNKIKSYSEREITKLIINGAIIDNKFVFHEIYYTTKHSVKQFPTDSLDTLFLDKGTEVTKVAHQLNHGKMWYLKQL